MYGDTTRIRARATALRTDATELRARGKTLRAEGDSLTWKSPAADALRERLTSTADELGPRARLLDDAADALERHARQVDEHKASIGQAMTWLSERRDEALGFLRSAEAGVETVAHEAVSRSRDIASALASPPAAGSRLWLDLSDTFRRRGW
jgi:chromosome segregation ATPase